MTDRAERPEAARGTDDVDAAVVERVRGSFARQGAMATLGANLAAVAAGHVAMALTLMPAESEVLSVEFKVNLLAPASGDRLVAEGAVVRAGRTLTVCRGDAYAEHQAERVHVATMLATMMRRQAR